MAFFTINKLLCFKLRTATFIFGYLFMVIKFLVLAFNVYNLEFYIRRQKSIADYPMSVLSFHCARCIFNSTEFTLGVISLIGIHKKKAKKLKIFYWGVFVTLLLGLFFLFYTLGDLVLSIICIIVIRSYYYRLVAPPTHDDYKTQPITDRGLHRDIERCPEIVHM